MRPVVLLIRLLLAACMERPPFGDTRTEAPPPTRTIHCWRGRVALP